MEAEVVADSAFPNRALHSSYRGPSHISPSTNTTPSVLSQHNEADFESVKPGQRKEVCVLGEECKKRWISVTAEHLRF